MRVASVLVLVLFVAQVHCAVLYATDTPTNATMCTEASPCALQDACGRAASGDTVQLLDGNYQLKNSPCIISSPSVYVRGGAGVAVVCNNACFVVGAVPFSLASLYLNSYGSTVPAAQAAIYGANLALKEGSAVRVEISDVQAQMSFNNLLYLQLSPPNNYTSSNSTLVTSLADVRVTGNTPIDAAVGPVAVFAAGHPLAWEFSVVTFDDFTSTSEVPLLDVGSQTSTTVVVDGLTVANSTAYAVFDTGHGQNFTIDNVAIDNVQNYDIDGRTAALIDVDGWSDVTMRDVSITNIHNDVSGLVFIGGHNAELSGVTVSSCSGADGQVPAVWTTCRQDPCTHTITEMQVTDTEYDLFGYFLYDYFSNTTLTIQSSSFTGVVSSGSQVLNVARCGVVLSDLTFTGGAYEWGAIGVSSPKSLDAVGLTYDNVTSPYALHSVSSEVAKTASLHFDAVEVQNSVVDQTIFLFIPGNSTWDVTISDSDFSTDGSNTTAIVSCYGDDTDNGGADVLVDTSTCNVGDQCAVIDEGYVSNDVCSFEVDSDAACTGCSSSSSGGGDDDDSPDWGKIVLWTLVGIAILVGIVIVIALIAVVVVVIVRKRRLQHGYEAI